MRPDESGNEDIMREAVSLLKRIELKCPSFRDLIVLGLNAQGWLFVYLGSDPMYRFDELGRLRRALVGGYLYRTSGSTLARLERSSKTDTTHSESVLLRHELTANELQAFQARVSHELTLVRDELPTAAVTRQQPSGEQSMPEMFHAMLETVLNASQFLAPAIVRR